VIKTSDEELEECERDIVVVGSETVGDRDVTRVKKIRDDVVLLVSIEEQ